MPSIHSPIVALLVGDIHLSIKPPIARAEEKSWFGAMEKSLAELRRLQEDHQAIVLCAGDVFDHWNSPPELINWALERLPEGIYSVPGQHDLPGHRPDLLYRSAYGTLVRAGKIKELGGWPILLGGMAIYGRPWGEEIPEVREGEGIKILVTHEYLWTSGTGHGGASRDQKLSKVGKKFEGFDVVVVGDNHVPFDRILKGETQVFNCGTFFRRKVSEEAWTPRIGLLHASGIVISHPLPIEGECFSGGLESSHELQEADDERGVDSFVEAVVGLESCSLDYRDNLMRAMESRKVSEEVREILLEAMEGEH